MDDCNLTGPSISLIEALLEEHFGSLPALIASLLARRGPLAVYEILESTGLKFWQVRNSLLILIQHNVVSFTSEGGASSASPNATEPVRYSINTQEALFRLRYPSYALYVSNQKGRLARLLITHVLKIGRASLKDAVHDVLNELGKR